MPASPDTGPPGPITALLHRSRAGDESAASELFERLYAELHQRAQLVAESANATLQPTALVHEAWLRLVPDRAPDFADRLHFLRAAAAAMRSVLIDHVRRRRAKKRGGNRVAIDINTLADLYAERAIDLVTLGDALERLAAMDAQLAQLVELRFFAGMEMAEIAGALGVSLSTVERAWRTARAWLRRELQP